jgi:putative membrane protein
MWIETAVIWLKVLHVGGLVVWAGLLFYMPALFAAHIRPMDTPEFHRLRTISRLTYVGIASPAAVVTIISGTALVVVTRVEDAWLVLKLGIVFLLLIYHIYCGTVLSRLAVRPTPRKRGTLLGLMIVPGLLLPVVLVLALDKPI